MPTVKSRIAALREVRSFSTCTAKELEQIARLVDEVDVDAGDVLMREGSPGRQSFVVLEGQAEITVAGRPVAVVGPGSFLGETALIDKGARTATVIAATPMRLLVVGPQAFSGLLELPGVSRRLAEQLTGRLRGTLPTHDES